MSDNENMWSTLRLPCEGRITLEEVQAQAMHLSASPDPTVHGGCVFGINDSTASCRRLQQRMLLVGKGLEQEQIGSTQLHVSIASPLCSRRTNHLTSLAKLGRDMQAMHLRQAISWPPAEERVARSPSTLTL